MLARTTTRGVALLMVATSIGRVAALAAQVVCGAVLAEGDFGAFATAIGIATVAGLLRGGYANVYLLSLPPARRRRRTGTVFWISMGLYLVGVGPMLAAAPWLSDRLGESRLLPILLLLGAMSLVIPLRYVLRSRIESRLEFGTTARATVLGNLVQYPTMIALVLWWRSPVALAAAPLAATIVETAYLWIRAHPHRTDFIPHRRFVAPLLWRLRWLVALAAMASLWEGGDYFVASLLVPTAVLGVYYFAYQLASQPDRLFTTTVSQVLIPVIRRVLREPARVQAAMARVVGLGGFGVAVVNVSLLAAIVPLERLIWGGKWAEAAFGVQILCGGLVFTTLFSIVTAPLAAERRYRDKFLCDAIRAAGLVGGAAIGAWIGGTAISIATAVAVATSIGSVVGLCWVMRRYGAPPSAVLVGLARSSLPVIAAGIAGALAGDGMLALLGEGRLASAAASVAAAGVFGGGVVLAALTLPPAVRRDLFELVPTPLRQRLLRVRPTTAPDRADQEPR